MAHFVTDEQGRRKYNDGTSVPPTVRQPVKDLKNKVDGYKNQVKSTAKGIERQVTGSDGVSKTKQQRKPTKPKSNNGTMKEAKQAALSWATSAFQKHNFENGNSQVAVNQNAADVSLSYNETHKEISSEHHNFFTESLKYIFFFFIALLSPLYVAYLVFSESLSFGKAILHFGEVVIQNLGISQVTGLIKVILENYVAFLAIFWSVVGGILLLS